jgi:ABC-type sugar transport system substrate-binding protein
VKISQSSRSWCVAVLSRHSENAWTVITLRVGFGGKGPAVSMDAKSDSPPRPVFLAMKEILFLIPARLTRPYFSSLCCECEISVYTRFGDELRPIWRCVTRETEEFDERTVSAILHREMRQSKAIGLLVVAPTASEQLTIAVADVARDRKVPVLALSLPFASPSVFTERQLPIPAAVYCDSASGARELARAASRELEGRSPRLTKPSVVLIPGQSDRKDSLDRLQSFHAGLIDDGLEPEITTANACIWQRGPARSEMTRILHELKHTIDLVFAANDEMALGARDAIREDTGPFATNCMIYGFDAITEVRSLVESGDHHMRGTSEQDIPQMAQSLTNLIDQVLRKNALTPPADVLIKPKPVLPPSAKKGKSRLEDVARSLPPLEYKSRNWVTPAEAAIIEGIKEASLRRYRGRSHGAEILDSAQVGRDVSGRIWCSNKAGRPYYLKESLVISPKVSHISTEVSPNLIAGLGL